MKLPENFNKSLRLLSKFNDIIEDRLSYIGTNKNKNTNKLLKEFEVGDEEIKELGNNLKEIVIEQKGLDRNSNEIAVLMGVEMLLGENKIEESLKLVRWRRKILKLIEVCGWEVGSEISRRTMKRLEVEIEDVIQVNLELAITDDDNLLSSFIEK